MSRFRPCESQGRKQKIEELHRDIDVLTLIAIAQATTTPSLSSENNED